MPSYYLVPLAPLGAPQLVSAATEDQAAEAHAEGLGFTASYMVFPAETARFVPVNRVELVAPVYDFQGDAVVPPLLP